MSSEGRMDTSITVPYNPHPPGAHPIPVWPAPLNSNQQGPYQVNFAHITWRRIGLRSPHNPPPTIPQTFPLFRKLPPELRIRIWTFSAPSRVLELRSWGSGRYPVKISVHLHRLPSLFRTCHESRMVALRIYLFVPIGVSYAIKDLEKTYVDWKYHPMNPAADPRETVGTAPIPFAEPRRPQIVRVSWERDTFYLGPDFAREHLARFFRCKDELPKLRRIAISRHLWCGREEDRDVLREALWRLNEREVEEVTLVPDDTRGPLIDRWYYGKHDIELVGPEWEYTFRSSGSTCDAKTVVEGLGEWFERLWRPGGLGNERGLIRRGGHGGVDGDEPQVSNKMGDGGQVLVPKVVVRSVRRSGKRMSAFKDGVWDIQREMGDMRVWKTWLPPGDPS